MSFKTDKREFIPIKLTIQNIMYTNFNYFKHIFSHLESTKKNEQSISKSFFIKIKKESNNEQVLLCKIYCKPIYD